MTHKSASKKPGKPNVSPAFLKLWTVLIPLVRVKTISETVVGVLDRYNYVNGNIIQAIHK
jgi:hypothetical protein